MKDYTREREINYRKQQITRKPGLVASLAGN